MPELDVGALFEAVINWLTDNFDPFFEAISVSISWAVAAIEGMLLFLPSYVVIAILAGLAWYAARRSVGLFTLFGMLLIDSMELWTATMETLALVMVSTLLALLVGIPAGIWASKSDVVERIVRPLLDLMQTMPVFVYLIPVVLLFSLGKVPGVVATFVFATPPAVRLTNLGIRQVPTEVVEAARSFGSTTWQMLLKVELPIALPTIMAGVNQTIMLALSMVVVAGMIGAGGLGEPVYKGITQLQIGLGFEGGLAVVILAVFLDRITQAIGEKNGPTFTTA